eukprot:COSAG02_NODE_4466_length_5332_cov_3.159564_2_plen_81_part_00
MLLTRGGAWCGPQPLLTTGQPGLEVVLVCEGNRGCLRLSASQGFCAAVSERVEAPNYKRCHNGQHLPFRETADIANATLK